MPTKKNPEVDHLEYVRQELAKVDRADRPRLAVDVGVSLSTLYNLMKGERDAKYSTVMTLYKALKAMELKGAKG